MADSCQSKKEDKDQDRYNQAPHLTQDSNGKLSTSQLDITIDGQEVSPLLAGDHKHQQTDVHESITKQDRNNITNQQKHQLGTPPASLRCVLEQETIILT